MLDICTPVKGSLTVTLFDKDNNIKEIRKVHNLVVNTGCQMIANILGGVEQAKKPSIMGFGTSAPTTPDESDTALVNPVYYVEFDEGFPEVPEGEASVVYQATFLPHIEIDDLEGGAASDKIIPVVEAGIFDEDKVMLNRTTFAVVHKAPEDTMSISWVVTFKPYVEEDQPDTTVMEIQPDVETYY